MDVAFVSEIKEGRRFFRYVDTSDTSLPIKVGHSDPVDEGYCQMVIDGVLPELILDARQHPVSARLPVTIALPIGAHLSVPIRLRDGTIFGTFCCFSHDPDPSLNTRDLQILRTLAGLAAEQIDHDLRAKREREGIELRIHQALRGSDLFSIYQPIVALDCAEVVGYEALARFEALPLRSPADWFAEAADVGLQEELELAAIRRAIEGFRWEDTPGFLSVNASPETVLGNGLADTISGVDPSRLVIEITEHAAVSDYEALQRALQPLKSSGVRLAIDDTGAGFASLRHILLLEPDFIKLDNSLTCDLDNDLRRRALAAALVEFARHTRGVVIAEGIETEGQMKALRDLGVALGQGYLLGRPGPLP